MESEIVKSLIGNAPAVIGVALWLSARLSRVEAEVAIIRSHFGLPPPAKRRRRAIPIVLFIATAMACWLLHGSQIWKGVGN